VGDKADGADARKGGAFSEGTAARHNDGERRTRRHNGATGEENDEGEGERERGRERMKRERENEEGEGERE